MLILDNFETVMAAGTQSGHYLSGYEGYGRLLELVGEQAHQSCLILTSREKPKELVVLEKRYLQGVVSLALPGLDVAQGQQLLIGTNQHNGRLIQRSDQQWQQLVNYYYGNPLALKLLAEPLEELFGGSIEAFLAQGWGVFADIAHLLEQQLARLSELEQQLLYWLAVERQAVEKQGYEGGSLLNLLVKLKADLRGADFSGLRVWQAYLQGVSLEGVNFSWSDLRGCLFSQAFSAVNTVAFSPDGRLVASGSADQTIRLWDVLKGCCFKTLEGHTNWVFVLGFSSDGKYLVSSGYDRRVKVWDTTTWQYLYDLEGHSSIVKTLAFKLGSVLMAGGDENYLRVWDLASRALVRTVMNPGLYEGLNIFEVRGLSTVQEANLVALGALRTLAFSTTRQE